jgi:hypothetical protein
LVCSARWLYLCFTSGGHEGEPHLVIRITKSYYER